LIPPQHFLNLRPLPQGQGSFRPVFDVGSKGRGAGPDGGGRLFRSARSKRTRSWPCRLASSAWRFGCARLSEATRTSSAGPDAVLVVGKPRFPVHLELESGIEREHLDVANHALAAAHGLRLKHRAQALQIGATNRFALHREEVSEERLPVLWRELEGDGVREIDRRGMQVERRAVAGDAAREDVEREAKTSAVVRRTGWACIFGRAAELDFGAGTARVVADGKLSRQGRRGPAAALQLETIAPGARDRIQDPQFHLAPFRQRSLALRR
jgi:hypothetical protein